MTIFGTPLSELRNFLDPLNVKNENILNPSKEIYNFELFQREFFNPPQKECTICLSPLSRSSKNFDPLTPVDHPPLAGLKVTNP